MSVSSYSQQNNCPDGATSLLVSGQSTTGTYTYPTTLTAGIYAVKVASLNKDTTGAYITATSNAQVENIANAATGYINLTTTESSFTLRPLGAAPTTYTPLFQTITSVLPNGMFGVAFGGSRYVFTGYNASSQLQVTSAASLFGAWTSTVNTEITTEPTAVYGNGKFVVATQSGVISSTDGIAWTTTQITGAIGSSNAIQINGLFHANNLFFATTNGSSLYTSTNATTWTTVYSNFGANRQINQAVYADSKYTAVGANGSIGSVGSDVRSWFMASASFGSSAVNTIFNGNGLYVIGGAGGTLRTSTDAITWTTRTSGFGSSAIQEITFGNGIWVSVGASGQLRSSTDTITWTTRTSQFGTSSINGVAYGAGVYVAVGANGRMTSSTDATTWTAVTTPGFGTSSINYITYTNGLFVAVGSGGRISSSTNGTTWTGVNAGTATLQAATYFNGNYIVAGSTGNIWASTDLITWTQRTSNTNANAFTLVHNGTNQIWTGGASGQVNVSTDGITWSGTTYGNPNGTMIYYQAAYGNGRYVISNNTNLVTISTDGVSWSTTASPSSGVNMAYGPTTGFMFGDGGAFWFTSTDGITWATATSSGTFSPRVNRLTYFTDRYVSLISGGSQGYYWSTNGVSWTLVNTTTSSAVQINQMAYDGTRYIVVNNNSETSTSTSLVSGWANTLGPTTASNALAVNGNNLLFGSGTNLYLSSDNGSSFATITPSAYSSGNYADALFGGGNYVFATGTVFASTDLVNWYSQALQFSKLAYGQYAGTNYYFGITTSSTSSPLYYNLGSDFTAGWLVTGNTFTTPRTATGVGVVGNRIFVGAPGVISVSNGSSIGSAFNEVVVPIETYAFTGFERNYYAFGTNGRSYFSSDGATWQQFATGIGNQTITTATYSNGLFLISGGGTQMATSTNGTTWTLVNSTPSGMNAQAVQNGTYYFSGDGPSFYRATSSYPMYYSIYGVNPNTI
jgi:hypothetical protein